MYALELKGVSRIYDMGGNQVVALDQVDLAVRQDEVVTLVGPSGSGKTTLLSIAGGLLGASSGQVLVGGNDITNASGKELTAFRRQKVGFIFQSVNLVPFLNARENLLVVAEFAKKDLGDARARAERLLEELGLGHRMTNLPGQLSGGERQRVAIGRALMNEPDLILVDEPTSALDSSLGEQVMELIVSEVKARGSAAVIVTHDARMTRYGDRIMSMADGRIQRNGAPERGVERPHHREAAERLHLDPHRPEAERSAEARGRHLPPPPPPPPPPAPSEIDLDRLDAQRFGVDHFDVDRFDVDRFDVDRFDADHDWPAESPLYLLEPEMVVAPPGPRTDRVIGAGRNGNQPVARPSADHRSARPPAPPAGPRPEARTGGPGAPRGPQPGDRRPAGPPRGPVDRARPPASRPSGPRPPQDRTQSFARPPAQGRPPAPQNRPPAGPGRAAPPAGRPAGPPGARPAQGNGRPAQGNGRPGPNPVARPGARPAAPGGGRPGAGPSGPAPRPASAPGRPRPNPATGSTPPRPGGPTGRPPAPNDPRDPRRPGRPPR